MRKNLARIGVVALCGLVIAGIAVALWAKPDLDEARDRVDRAWADLHPMLVVRYDALAGAGTLAEERLGRPSDLLASLDEAMTAWRTADTATGQVAAANRLEGLAARLAVTAEATPRLRSSVAIRDGLAALRASAPEPARTAYNDTVARYEDSRGGWIRRLLAGALGFDPSRSLESPAA